MANVRITSFQKKGKSAGVIIRGTKASFQNSQLLISSGVPSLDALLGNFLIMLQVPFGLRLEWHAELLKSL